MKMTKRPEGFSRIDLVVVLATISLLALTIFGDSYSNAEAAVCQNHMRLLARAQFLYAADNSGYFPPNSSDGGSTPTRAWVTGIMDRTTSDSTNVNRLLSSLLIEYLDRNTRAFKCPSERSPALTGLLLPRVRTVSMNHAVGTDPSDADGPCKRPTPGIFLDGGGQAANQVFRCYARPSDIVNPSPANLWIFLDEHPDSINDAMFASVGPGVRRWVDLAAAYHDRAGSFGFADGRAQLHRWNQPFAASLPFIDAPVNPSNLVDEEWLAARTTARRSEQP